MENIDIDLQQVDIQNVDSVLTGPQGPAGFSPIANVSKTGNVTTITITDEDGTTTAQILDGTDGQNGQNNTLTIGTVTTGVNPSATITGDSPNQVLNLVLPKGDTGAAGQAGADGTTPTVTVGTTTTLPSGSPATVTQSGTATNVILNFGIPRGSNANALSVPTIVDELPDTGDPNTFYFVPLSYTSTEITNSSISFNVSANRLGRIEELDINGNLEKVYSKNLFDPVTAEMTVGLLRMSGAIDTSQTNRMFTNGFIKVDPNTTYTFQFQSSESGKAPQAYAIAYQSDKTTITGGLPTAAWYTSSFTFTTGANDEYIRFSFSFSDNSTMTTSSIINQQLEAGSSPTSYEAYHNPYLIPVKNNVTVAVNGVDNTISLGDTYLAKINTSADKIYSDGTSYYLHREIGYIASYVDEDIQTAYVSTSGSLTVGDEVYYVLDTPSNTLIEDTDIIDALNLIKTPLYPVGTNTLVASGDTTVTLSIEWHEIDPHHQYQKYVYIIDTANWEEI